ncbi:MAG: glycosyltransferase [Spirochaetaceae bacterium]
MEKKSEEQLEQEFLKSERSHILMITNHGIHQWEVVPGLPDTGGQNVYVNQLTEVLADFGFKITIVNRGGYPHPTTGEMRRGRRYKDARRRILYIEDTTREFVRKEAMKPQIPELVDFLYSTLDKEGQKTDLIVSHYWDAALLGAEFNDRLTEPLPHLWVPHSLGAIKKRNMPPESWEDLRVDERIATEREFIPRLDHIAATSSLIRDSLREDYGREISLFLPPCVNPDKFYPRKIEEDHEIRDFLVEASGLPKERLKKSRFIMEVSRTDKTKRKDVLIKAFAEALQSNPDLVLVVSIDETEEELYGELTGLIKELDIEDEVIVIGHEAARLPYLYSLLSLYCSPSVMEGFGMSVQEAAATAVPVVASDKIPFVVEYLLGENVEERTVEGVESGPVKIGEGGIVVPSDEVAGFSYAVKFLLEDEKRRREMGEKALDITVPYFTWEEMTRRLLNKMGVSADG